MQDEISWYSKILLEEVAGSYRGHKKKGRSIADRTDYGDYSRLALLRLNAYSTSPADPLQSREEAIAPTMTGGPFHSLPKRNIDRRINL